MINFRSEIHLALLGYYFKNPKTEHYVRELSKLLSLDVAQLSRELKLLTRSEIFLETARGHEKYFRLNRAWPLYGELEKLTLYLVDKKSTR